MSLGLGEMPLLINELVRGVFAFFCECITVLQFINEYVTIYECYE